MPDSDSSTSIDRRQAVLLASRIFAAFLLFWVADDIIALPRELFEVLHYFRQYSQAGFGTLEALRLSYFYGDSMMVLLANILRIALWLLAAGWFYRCGPRISNFFAAGNEKSQPSPGERTTA